jgi:hypothetical protein
MFWLAPVTLLNGSIKKYIYAYGTFSLAESVDEQLKYQPKCLPHSPQTIIPALIRELTGASSIPGRVKKRTLGNFHKDMEAITFACPKPASAVAVALREV